MLLGLLAGCGRSDHLRVQGYVEGEFIYVSSQLFPFRGMPVWAQAIGEIMPLTHFMRIARGILLKGNGLGDIVPEIWPIALTIGVKRYRQTLD